MKRREFIAMLGGAAAAWPLAARAQEPERMRRIGVLMNRAADDREGQARLVAFQQALQQLGWSEGRNMRMDTRWGENDIDRQRRYAAELVALAPDVILASGGVSVSALQHVTRTLPIVFAAVGDPVGIGLVDSLARQIVPRVTRAAVLRNPAIPAGIGQFSVIQAVAPSLGVDVSPIGVHDLGEIERAVAAFARAADGGLIVTASALASVPRDRIIALAARHKLPAVYSYRYMVTGGGLVSYGPDLVDQFRRAAGYVDRILKGETAANLPVQAPTKYELVINLKTAKALGIEVPPTLLARADEVIE
jgi:putative tryptophan/tyrosine transport system substrate-binding protein